MANLDRKVALITGGTSGIGLATAKRFVADGAYVFVTGRRESELDPAAKEIGRNVTAVQGDVSRLADLDRLVAVVYRDAIPLGRVGRPDEFARAVSFLASGDASYVAGTELFVDGGLAQV